MISATSDFAEYFGWSGFLCSYVVAWAVQDDAENAEVVLWIERVVVWAVAELLWAEPNDAWDFA